MPGDGGTFFEQEAVEAAEAAAVDVVAKCGTDPQYSRPEVPGTHPAKRQRYDDNNIPIETRHGARTGVSVHRSDKFRVGGCKAFITYSALTKDEFTKQEVHDMCVKKCRGGCKEIVVGLEIHPHPSDPAKNVHFHVFLWSNEPFDTTLWPGRTSL